MSAHGEAAGGGGISYPPYAPYQSTPAPPSLADTISAGKFLRVQHKSAVPKKTTAVAKLPPKPAKPKTPKVTDIKMPKKTLRAHARCLRRHGAVLTDRLEYMAKPKRHHIICFWRQYADFLPPETIERLRRMLDANEPFKPDQAYEYFTNLRKAKKKQTDKVRVSQVNKDLLALCGDRRFTWARNATVAFARGMQQRLSRPCRYVLADGMLRLSDIVLGELCKLTCTKQPSRKCTRPRSKFMLEMADKIAVWIDEILSESDERMLMMDFDEDDEVERSGRPVMTTEGGGFEDDFLKMMAGKGAGLLPESPAYKKFTGDMADAFRILTTEMTKKGNKNLLTHGKFSQTYKQAADDLKTTTSFDAVDYDTALSEDVNKKLTEITKSVTPPNIAPSMKEMINICSKYLAQNAEHNKDKGEAFKYLVKKMRGKPNENLFTKGKIQKTNGEAARELETAKGLTSDHDDPNLSQAIHSNLSKLVADTPPELKDEMNDTLDLCSKYLSQKAVDDNERGPAFDMIIKELKKKGNNDFVPSIKGLAKDFDAAHALKNAPGLASMKPEPGKVPMMKDALHREVDDATPPSMKKEMEETIDRCADYLSGYARDREKAKDILVKTMKDNGTKEAAKRNNVPMTYATGAKEVESSPTLVPLLPVKDIKDEMGRKVSKDVASATPADLKPAMKTMVNDATGELSQNLALKSGAAGERYPLDLLSAVANSLGDKPLIEAGPLKLTYAEAAEKLKHSGPLESDPQNAALANAIAGTLTKDVPTKLTHDTTSALSPTIANAAGHLAKIGAELGAALDHLLGAMKGKGDAQLATISGTPETYKGAAEKIEAAPSLANDTVDKAIYDTVKGKLKDLCKENPAPQHDKAMPEIIDAVAKFLAVPMSSEDAKQMQLTAALTKKGSQILDTDDQGPYKMTYKDAAKELKKVLKDEPAIDAAKKEKISGKVEDALGDPTIKEALKDETTKASEHLANVATGRGHAMKAIQDKLKIAGEQPLSKYQGAQVSHGEGAVMLDKAKHFGPKEAPEGMADDIREKIHKLGAVPDTSVGKLHMKSTTEMVARHLAAETGKKGGYVPGSEGEGGPAGAGGFGADGQPETDEQRRKRLEAEKKAGGGSPGSYTADGRLIGPDGKPETEEQRVKRLAAEAAAAGAKLLGPDGKPETEEQRRKRLEAEKKAGGGSPGSYTADGRLIGPDGKPETEEQRRKRLEAEAKAKGTLSPDGRLIGPDGKPETEEQRQKRLEAERKAGGGSPGSYTADGRLIGPDGKPETDEQRRKRLEAEKKAGGGSPGSYTADGRLIGPDGKPETEEQRRKRLAAEAAGVKLLGPDGKPETEEERRKRLEAEKKAGGGSPDGRLIGPDGKPETEEQRRKRLEAEKKAGGSPGTLSPDGRLILPDGSLETDAQRRKRLKQEEEEERKRAEGGGRGGDAEYDQATGILHGELRKKGKETFYKQAQTELTHGQAADILASKRGRKVDTSVRDASDTGRLSNKFERKLSNLVAGATPTSIQDTMTDVIIESSRKLSECFVSDNYKKVVDDALIAEMQKKGNEILAITDAGDESFFFAAQRMKLTNNNQMQKEPHEIMDYTLFHELTKKLDDCVKCRTVPRKMLNTLRDHVRLAANFLCEKVTKPNPKIQAYVTLLDEMEEAGAAPLVEGDIPKTYEAAAQYLKTLTSFTDQINRSNSSLRSNVESKLKNLMKRVEPNGYTPSDMDSVIKEQAGLLVSYITQEEEKTKALKLLVRKMEEAGDSMILRHGTVRKSFFDGVDLLKNKNTDQLVVHNADPVVSRKIQIKLTNLMLGSPDNKAPMSAVIEDSTKYLAVHLLRPHIIKVCKCTKSVCVQCELWCEEILRHVSRPSCTCSRHVSAHDMPDDTGHVRRSARSSRAFIHSQISLQQCPEAVELPSHATPCPAMRGTRRCPASRLTTAYYMYAGSTHTDRPDRADRPDRSDHSPRLSPTRDTSPAIHQIPSKDLPQVEKRSSSYDKPNVELTYFSQRMNGNETPTTSESILGSPVPINSSSSVPLSGGSTTPYWQNQTTMMMYSIKCRQSRRERLASQHVERPNVSPPVTPTPAVEESRSMTEHATKMPVVTTDQMSDLHAMIVSLMWNVQAWREWLQEHIDRAIAARHEHYTSEEEAHKEWADFQRRVMTEALQWRQYNIFSRRLTLRLALRYKDKQILSPTRATVKTQIYVECQQEMLEIIDMFNKWTLWLMAVLKETQTLKANPDSGVPLHELRWSHFKRKVEANLEDWVKYNHYLKHCCEHKYKAIISDWVPSWKQEGTVWVVSACGAVPSGAVAAGEMRGELIWLARTTHKCDVLPAALVPTMHCCLVYADGAVHRYTKYQVMCNADVKWIPWRADSGCGGRGVCVSAEVRVGRVLHRGDHLLGAVRPPHQRCHVVLYGRPVAFNCYELLVFSHELDDHA